MPEIHAFGNRSCLTHSQHLMTNKLVSYATPSDFPGAESMSQRNEATFLKPLSMSFEVNFKNDIQDHQLININRMLY